MRWLVSITKVKDSFQLNCFCWIARCQLHHLVLLICIYLSSRYNFSQHTFLFIVSKEFVLNNTSPNFIYLCFLLSFDHGLQNWLDMISCVNLSWIESLIFTDENILLINVIFNFFLNCCANVSYWLLYFSITMFLVLLFLLPSWLYC